MLIYNGSGGDIQLFKLDADGKRLAPWHASAQDISSSIMTYVDSPWIVADASGQCLEIVLPGQQTRFHTVEERRHGGQQERRGATHGAAGRKRGDAAPIYRGAWAAASRTTIA